MKKLLLAGVGLAALAGPAVAADLGARPIYKAPPVAAPVYSWTGCYVGAGGGYGMFNDDTTATETGEGVFSFPKVTTGGRGWFGTVQGGCDYQFAPSWVIGAFADYDFGSIKGDAEHWSFLFGEEKLNWSWAAGGRIGYLPTDRLLTYVSAGGTQAHFKEIDYSFDTGAASGYSLSAHTYTGWFIGGGYEYNLGFLPGLFWKTEYRFADYGKRTANADFGGVPVTGLSIEQHPYVQTIRSELVYRFNWGH